ncbi:MAG: hypothetical protein Q4C64_06770 [Erysipelotrichia bacterium]|nr:hypothetical protein [Erysipelotrichia bacterium]
MSTLEEKIVSLKFRGAEQFQKDADNSSASLEKLNKQLGGTDSTLSKALTTGLNVAGNGVLELTTKFSKLEMVAVGALTNIGARIESQLNRVLKTLTIDNVMSGFTKYNQKTASVQTLVNATGKSVNDINAYLNKLMWFSDETSYSFTDMTSALSTMVSSGGDIEKLIPMIEGVANAVSFAGKGSAEFSRLMAYSINQAYSLGYMGVQDWKSIESATVNSKQLMESLIAAGVRLGKIKPNTVTVQNFRSTLAKKWLDKEVMEEGFGYFSQVTEEIYEGIQNGTFDSFADGLEKIGYKYGEVANRAAASAQEAKSFKEAIEATTDAVSSNWMSMFEYIFGNYEEAKVLWTDLADALNSIFVAPVEKLKEGVQAWNEAGGRSRLIDIIYTLYEDLGDINGLVSKILKEIGVTDLLHKIFPEDSEHAMWAITEGLEKFEDKLYSLGETISDVLDKIKLIKRIKLDSKTGEFLGINRSILSSDDEQLLGKYFEKEYATQDPLKGFLYDDAYATTDMTNLIKIKQIVDNINAGIDGFKKGLVTIKDGIMALIPKIKDAIGPVALNVFDKIGKIFKFLGEGFNTIVSGIGNWITNFKMPKLDMTLFKSIWEFIKSLWGTLKTGVIGNVLNQLKNLFSALGDTFNPNVIEGAGAVIFMVRIKKLFDSFKKIFNSPIVKELKEGKKLFGKDGSIKETVEGIAQIFNKDENKTSNLYENIDKFSKSVLLLAIAVLILAAVDATKALNAVITIGLLMTEIIGAMAILDVLADANKKGKGITNSLTTVLNAASMITIVGSLVALSAALILLSFIDQHKLLYGETVMMILLALLTATIYALSKIKFKDVGGILAGTVGMIGVATSLVILSAALGLLSLLNMTKILQNVVILGFVSGALALIAKVLKGNYLNMMKASLAMTVLSVGMIALAVGLKALKILGGDMKDILNSMLGLVLTIGIFAGLAVLLQPTFGAMLVLSKILLTIAASAALFAISLAALGVGIVVFCETLEISAGFIGRALTRILLAWAEAISVAAPALINSVVELLLQLLITLDEKLPEIGNRLLNIILDLINWCYDNINKIIGALTKLLIVLGVAIVDVLILLIGTALKALLPDLIPDDFMGDAINSVKEFADKILENIDTEPINIDVVYNVDKDSVNKVRKTSNEMSTPVGVGTKGSRSVGRGKSEESINKKQQEQKEINSITNPYKRAVEQRSFNERYSTNGLLLAIGDTLDKRENSSIRELASSFNSRNRDEISNVSNDMSSNVQIDSLVVNVNNTNASTKDITDAVTKGLTKRTNRQNSLKGRGLRSSFKPNLQP